MVEKGQSLTDFFIKSNVSEVAAQRVLSIKPNFAVTAVTTGVAKSTRTELLKLL